MALLEFLSRIDLFADLTIEEVFDIIDAIHALTCREGETVFEQDDPGDAAYIVESGELGVFKDGEGCTVRVATLGAGAVFGELALLDGARRSATVRALTDCHLLRLDRVEFDQLRYCMRPAAYKMMRTMASEVGSRLRATTDHVADLLAQQAATQEPVSTTTSGREDT